MFAAMISSHRTLACIVVAITLGHLVSGAPVATDDIAKSIEEVQKKFADSKSTEPADELSTAENKVETAASAPADIKRQGNDLVAEESIRNNKMLDYYGYYSGGAYPSAAYPAAYPGYSAMYAAPYPPYYSSEEYDDDYNSNNIDEEDDDAFSRANNRRKPGNGAQNSPIFYIRLPPTPYMFVPGMGYISQPPTLQPIAPQYSLPPPPPPQGAVPAVSPFINLPINFLSNGKPTGIYQWNGGSSFGPQFPSYLPPRPRPTYQRPPKPYIQAPQNSKVTHLKGQYLFNGRPEDIYLLNPHYSSPYSAPYPHNPYAAPPPPYGGYPSVYHPAPIPGYY